MGKVVVVEEQESTEPVYGRREKKKVPQRRYRERNVDEMKDAVESENGQGACR